LRIISANISELEQVGSLPLCAREVHTLYKL